MTDNITTDIYEKQAALKKIITDFGNVAVAFSGGVDSTFLLKSAHDALGDKCIAVIAKSASFPERELKSAIAFCKKEGIRYESFEAEETHIEGFSQNPRNRCYLCKSSLFKHIWDFARSAGFSHIAEGSNVDDEGDYRPGLQAIKELGVDSPLRMVGLHKSEIRELSREMGLETWDKPSFACLASRFPYGEEITIERLKMVEKAEGYLMELGLRQVRVRNHSGNLARIETDEDGFLTLTGQQVRKDIYKAFKEMGFAYVSIDLLGYRMGSMNEV